LTERSDAAAPCLPPSLWVSSVPTSEVTRILFAIHECDRQAVEQMLPLVYDELRKLALQRLANERPRQTLQAAALVHDAISTPRGKRRNGVAPEG
jgi:hypothetical protein